MSLDIDAIRAQFPFLQQDPQPVYFDSAATAQMPESVIRTMQEFDSHEKANVHRGVHTMTEKASIAYEKARSTVQHFIHAAHSDEIIFTKNCTEAINLAAHGWARSHLKEGDTIALSLYEHHSNIVPWHMIAQQNNLEIVWFEDDIDAVLDAHNVQLVSITGKSNVTGYCPEIKTITSKAHEAGAKVCIDAAQLIAHAHVDVQDINCDFLAFSGHKLYGPTGIGVLYAKRSIAQNMQPMLGGGMMIGNVSKDGFTPAEPPACFEAGTPPITQAIGLATAIDWLSQFSWDDIAQHENTLISHAVKRLSAMNGINLIPCHPKPDEGPSPLSFTTTNTHPHDLTDLLGEKNIALRAGHHCCQPLHDHLGIAASVRLSVGMYNTTDEIDVCTQELEKIIAALQ